MHADDLVRRAVPLARIYRGDTLESAHAGHVAVVDREGRLLFRAGDADVVTFTRSALKPLQALPFVEAGGDVHFGYSRAQVALLCASHSGEQRHVVAVADMLARCGVRVDELQCGSHVPRFYELTGEFPPPPPYSPLQHNCSGKHAGMLACCVLHGYSRDDYLAYAHPLQAAIRRAVAATAGVGESDLIAGTDGCSAPNYAVPLARLAHAYARLAVAHEDSPALANLASAMNAHPEMVSGLQRSDLALMQAGRGDWVTKIGAEGVQALGIRSRGIGIAIKVADGSTRGLHPATIAVLEALDLVDAEARQVLAQWSHPVLSNFRGLQTGRIEPAVALVAAD
ncbi:MAG: asparaginase [Casimicrobiaceae bacterium]